MPLRYAREFLLMEEFAGQNIFVEPPALWPEERHRAFRALRLAKAKAQQTKSALGEVMATAAVAQESLHRSILLEGGR